MTVVNPKSISGINSITTGSGSDNLLTIHTSDASSTERVRINSSGDVIVGSGITVSPDGDIFATGVCTATTFSGSGASLTNLPAANITGTLPAISGANLTNLDASDLASGTVPTARLGSGTASSSTFLRGDSTFAAVTSTTINSNADNRLITGSGTANTLNGESDLTFNGSKLSLSLAGGSNHIVELVNTSANSNEGTVLKLRASGRGGAEDNADVFLTTNNTDTRVFSVTNAGTVNTTGNIVMASGKGIDFSGTDNGTGTMSSELFDDYEEGTWVPDARDGSLSYSDANYTKIGRMVYVSAYVHSFTDTSTNDQVTIQGLPFNVGVGGVTGGSVMYQYVTQAHACTVYIASTGLKFYGGNTSNYDGVRYNELSSSHSFYFHAWYIN